MSGTQITDSPYACLADGASAKVNCLCLGTGRFLRNVLVPILNKADLRPALIQTRGTSFLKYMQDHRMESKQLLSSTSVQDALYYEADTVLRSGDVVTDQVSCYGVLSLGRPECRKATWDFVSSLQQDVLIIGVGVTEAGLMSSETSAMQDLMELLRVLSKRNSSATKICIIDLDNVSDNGNVIQSHLESIAAKEQTNDLFSMQDFLAMRVVCLNTMVDRITSFRPDDPNVPRAEPLPIKALVVLDPECNLPSALRENEFKGLLVRSTREQLDADLALKLRVANGTHTAIAHAMALQGILTTDVLGADSYRDLWIESYLESLVKDQILTASPYDDSEAEACWNDWKHRLTHPFFGLSSFFITQNGAAKAGIRWSGTITDLISQQKAISVGMVFAYAALIRWLTPQHYRDDGVFVGWLDGATKTREISGGTEYADGMRYNVEAGWYEFKCTCNVGGKPFSECLMNLSSHTFSSFCANIREYLLTPSGGNLESLSNAREIDVLVRGIAALVVRLVTGETVNTIMMEMHRRQGVYVHGFSTDSSVLGCR